MHMYVLLQVLIINLLAGYLSDHYGRRTVLLSFGLVHVLASALTTFASSYWHFIVVRCADITKS